MLACKAHGSQQPPIPDSGGAAACPTYLDLELDGAGSRFNPGWSGSTHGVGLPTGSQLSVKIDECDPECRRCKFHGPVRGDPAKTPVITQRCLGNVAQICTDDDPTSCQDKGQDKGPCRFMFPPIASKVPPFPTCALAYFDPVTGTADPSPVQGVMDLETGESDLPVLNILVRLHIGNCVDCASDPKQFDGVAGGTCVMAGPPVACDVNGIGTAITSSTSFDCPMPVFLSTITLGTNGTSTSSVRWTMDGDRPKCTANAKPCWCGMCTNGTPCTSNRDCPNFGTCGVASTMIGTQTIPWKVANNACTGTCNWDPATQSGKCSAPAGLSCFPDTDPMIATGLAEVHDGFYISQLANLICMPSFNTGVGNGGLVDSAGGFPGPFLFESRFRVTTRSGP